MCDIQPLSMACPNTFTARRPNFGARRLGAHAPPLPRRRRIKASSRPHFDQTQVALQHSDSWKILVFQQRYRNKQKPINFHNYLLFHICAKPPITMKSMVSTPFFNNELFIVNRKINDMSLDLLRLNFVIA